MDLLVFTWFISFINLIVHLNCLMFQESFQSWTNQLSLESGMEIKWNSQDTSYITIEISAPTTGYVGLGFSPNGGMKGSDIVIGWVDKDGIPYLVDLHSPHEHVQPLRDDQQDYDLIAASENNGRTTVRFRRRWDTCDKNDMRIGEDTIRLIWAWHPTDPMTFPSLSYQWHGTLSRGTKSAFLRSAPPTGAIKFPDESYSEPADNVRHWDVALQNVRIEGKPTTYMCKIFKFPKPERKHHIVGFRPLVFHETREFVHHATIYTCHVADNYGGTRRVFEKFVGAPQAECFTSAMPPEWGTHCLNFLFVWGPGSDGEMLPEHIGIPAGDNYADDATYYKLEVHYNNPMRKTFIDSSGLRIFFTDQLRQHNAGIMFLGHRVTPFQMIPQYQHEFKIHSFCSKECTQNGITTDNGINITSVLLHAHLAGRKISFRHVRNGRELPVVIQDQNFDFNYQQFRSLKDEVRILAGDELMLECDYDTYFRNSITFGGLSSDQEMCQAFAIYYPKTDLTDCRSQPEFYSFFSALGMTNVSGSIFEKMGLPFNKFRPYVSIGSIEITPMDNSFQLSGTTEGSLENPFEFAWATSPASLRNTSVGTYLRNLNWHSHKLVKQIENQWRDGLHYMFCSASGLRRIPLQEMVTKYPKFEPYTKQIDSDCRYENYGNIRNPMLLAPLLVTIIILVSI